MPEKNKRLKEITAKHILENFQKLGKPGDRYSHRRSTQSDAGSEDDSSSMRSTSYRYGSPEDANWVIGVDKINHLVSMCGGDLKNFESFYLLRRSNYVSIYLSALYIKPILSSIVGYVKIVINPFLFSCVGNFGQHVGYHVQ